jgi:hypothetical protein
MSSNILDSQQTNSDQEDGLDESSDPTNVHHSSDSDQFQHFHHP